MTDMGQPRGAAGPPWSVDLLAELHAGALDDAEAARLWPEVQADPEAMAVLSALDATRTDLSAFAEAPVEPMPAEVAARIDAALAQEAGRGQLAPVVDLAAARRKRANRLMGWGVGLVATAAAVVAAVAVVSPGTSTPGTPLAGEGAEQPGGPAQKPLAVSGDKPESAVNDVRGVTDYGGLKSRDGLDACLEAHDIPTDGDTAGIRPAKVDGKDAVLAVLTTGELATYRIVAVSPDCSTDNPGKVYINKIFGKGGN